MLIRKAAPRDLDGLMRIEEESFQEERFSRNLLELFMGGDEFDTVVCEVEGKVVGYAASYIEPGVRTRVLSLAVDKEHRSLGIGRRLMRRIEEGAKSSGSKEMTLEVRVTNVPAVRLYLNEGYVIRGTVADYYGKGQHAFYMEKKL